MKQLTRTELLKDAAKAAGVAAVAGSGGALRAASAYGATDADQLSEALKGTLTVWQHQSPIYNKNYAQLGQAFMKKHPQVKINNLYIPYAQFESKALIAFTSGQAPDIIKLGAWDIANYASKGLISPVDYHLLGYSSSHAFESAYAPGALGALTYSNQVYGLPIDYNSLFLFYRRDHFEQAGLDPDKPPTTWEQVAQYAQKLTQRDSSGNLTRAGFQLWYDLPIWDFLNFIALPAGAGGGVLGPNNQGALSTPAGIKALTWYGNLSNVWKVASPKFTDPNFNYGQIANGKASMSISANFAVALIAALGKIKLGKEFDVAPMPQWATPKKHVVSGYSWAWLVSKKSRNPAAAWNFLRYLQNSSSVSSQLYVSDLITPIKGWQTQKAAAGPGTQIVAKEIPFTTYGPTLPQWAQMAQQLSNNLVALALGQKSPTQAAGDFDNAMKRIA